MASPKKQQPYYMTTDEFGERLYQKYLQVIEVDHRDKLELEMINFNICIKFKENKTIKINLGHLYKKCFVDYYGKISPERIESLIDEFVKNSLTGLKGKIPLITGPDTGFSKIRNTIFPVVKAKRLVDNYNKIGCAKSAENKIAFFPFRSLPGIGVSLATMEGPLIEFVNRSMIQCWSKDPKAEMAFQAYMRREEEQLNLILDLDASNKDILQEEIALLRIAKENYTNLINKKYKKGSNMWYKFPSNAFKAEMVGEEYSNLSGSLLLLPELIIESRLNVKGDTIAVAAEESTLFIGGAQDPLALCFIGDLAVDSKDDRNSITVDPLRLVKSGNNLWKWVHYVPNIEKMEFSVPVDRDQVTIIFKAISTAPPNDLNRRYVPVFKNLLAPLTLESQKKIVENLDAQKLGKPHCVDIPMCWYCGSADKKLKQCEGCLLARYCERKCQKGHWKLHKVFCKSRTAQRSNKSGPA
ncbi:uncharacterized protein LOC116307485 [Actinia tenebrosa]|uniref:Uncharacterized protein LOC116307485 n=1 Tax=Actinia tenebrosa TaxID=6105 RepID=A0A6P8J6V5_ACTTE|nr:uncharacterized protein LOC116307485 [Actinia tenebrosa]